MNNIPLSQSLVDQANAAYRSGEYVNAARSFEEAARSYAGAGDVLMAAEMQNNRSVALLRGKDPQAAFEASQGTEKVFAGAGDLRREGMALANQASALQVLKRYGEAIDLYKRSADALQKADQGNLRMEVMQLLSILYFRRFKFYDAILSLQSGLTGARNLTPRQRFMKKILFFHL